MMTLSHNKKAPKCLLVEIEEVRVVKSVGWRKQGVLCLIECTKSPDGNGLVNGLLNSNDQCRIELLLNYLEDGDLRQWRLPDVLAFNIGISEWRSKLNCIINPHMYDQVSREII
ncbi:uncharacterized protein LOC110687307 [Chenopodium quinoa]|uniref:uncharacterized protein LOC110687307 n=1 Tax=Chenopodium quinoa TaxID=63459 RepID=UPI000B786A5B|nr:uncharacterized protein LOC110687307 [Chenopodium quinoa]